MLLVHVVEIVWNPLNVVLFVERLFCLDVVLITDGARRHSVSRLPPLPLRVAFVVADPTCVIDVSLCEYTEYRT